jgi:hypothetical protein
MKRVLVALVGCLALVSCGGAGDTGSSAALTPQSHVDKASGSFDTFARAPAAVIVVAKLTAIRDAAGHPFVDVHGLRYREMRVHVLAVLRGEGIAAGGEATVLSADPIPGADLTDDDLGQTFLLFGGTGDVTAFDGSRNYKAAFGFGSDHSYEMKRVRGDTYGIRFVSPRFYSSYEGNRRTIYKRLLQGQSVREVDAPLWSNLLNHATHPRSADDPDRLGKEEDSPPAGLASTKATYSMHCGATGPACSEPTYGSP